MLFNSPTYAVFFAIVLLLYWTLATRHLQLRNLFLLSASYIFYGWWDWRFLGLIIASSAIDFTAARMIDRCRVDRYRKIWLVISLVANLSVLGFLKYFNFFLDSLQHTAPWFGYTPDWPTWNIVLPVGISFYTLQTMSYTIDVYRRQIPPCREPVAFFAYVCFFPQLVAGPIERAGDLLPQFKEIRGVSNNQARDAFRQILWGLVQKVVIADSCGTLADPVFAKPAAHHGGTIALAAVYFAFQIYGDFAGYSNIAIGSARLLGFDLRPNFRSPYFAASIRDFWQRWHISLSEWFRDYVYIPLGGNRRGRLRGHVNILIVFAISGLWHGAAWNFLLWGLIHGGMLVVQRTAMPFISVPPRLQRIIGPPIVFTGVTVAWLFFRIESFDDAIDAATRLFTRAIFSHPDISRIGLTYVTLMLVGDAFSSGRGHPLHLRPLPVSLRWLIYTVLIIAVLGYYQPSSSFIYFQF